MRYALIEPNMNARLIHVRNSIEELLEISFTCSHPIVVALPDWLPRSTNALVNYVERAESEGRTIHI